MRVVVVTGCDCCVGVTCMSQVVVGVGEVRVVLQVPMRMMSVVVCHYSRVGIQFLRLRLCEVRQFVFFLPLHASVLKPDLDLSFGEV